MEPCLLSIVIPVYNVEAYLLSCLDSVYFQNFPSREIIIVNDGSADRSGELILAWMKGKSGIVYLEQENRGLGAARNSGLKHAKGKYIYFLDSDDFLKEGALSQMILACEEKELDVFAFSSEPLVEDDYSGSLLTTADQYLRKINLPEPQRGPVQIHELERAGSFFPCVWAYLAKRELLDRQHLFFREELLHEDNVYTMELFLHARRVAVSREVYHVRRYRNASIMHRPKAEKQYLAYQATLKVLLEYLQTHPEDRPLLTESVVQNWGSMEKLFWHFKRTQRQNLRSGQETFKELLGPCHIKIWWPNLSAFVRLLFRKMFSVSRRKPI